MSLVGLDRRAVCLAMLAGAAWHGGARAAAEAGFAAFLQGLAPLAAAQGVRPDTFAAVTAGLTLDPSVPRSGGGQPEFERPVSAYVAEAVSPGRVAQGRRLAATNATLIAALETRFGVPGSILLAAWAMESDFGRARGTRDIVRSLASLAFTRPDRPLFRDEFVAALAILQSGAVERAQMTGSWAGAMGDPQFMPSAYRKFAVSVDGAGAPDIWTSQADILASIGNFLRLSGWQPGQPWAVEVRLPAGFAVPTLHASAVDWAGFGLTAMAAALPTEGEAALYCPAGAGGPAFLLCPNHFVIKQYNNSDSYALALGLIAGRLDGQPPLATAWPRPPVNLSRSDKSLVQTRLAALGLYAGPADGKFGPLARDAVHAYQKQAGVAPADGFATPALVARLRAGTP